MSWIPLNFSYFDANQLMPEIHRAVISQQQSIIKVLCVIGNRDSESQIGLQKTKKTQSYNQFHFMQNSALPAAQSPKKSCSPQSEQHSSQDTIHSSQCLDSSESQEAVGKYAKLVSHTRQNKDGANAARTARITLISMILEQDRRGVTQALRHLNEDAQVKKTMLNIGQREFKARFLLQPELRAYFARVLDGVSLESVEQFIRRNKRSRLNYKSRLQLCYNYIRKYKQHFDSAFQTIEKPAQQTELDEQITSEWQTILVPVALQPAQYQLYMQEQGFIWML